jgi:YegS/Rv2252/BmrU family lipid kinase
VSIYRHVHVIINPASGPDRPVLGILNSIFHPADVDWDVFVTKKAGDARRYALEAVAHGVDAVAVYGGDGTVNEAASGLVGTDVPLAILPGGTGNVLSVELGIPGDLAEACALLCNNRSNVCKIDVGQVGSAYCLLSASVGFATAVIQGADRATKQRLGTLAYVLAGLQALRDPAMARYHLTLDGKQIEREGITCMIINSGNLGQAGWKIVPGIDLHDGLLDVIVIRRGDLGAMLSVAASVVTRSGSAPSLQHWQAREIDLVADPPQTVQVDGEILDKTPITARVLPSALGIIVPKEA